MIGCVPCRLCGRLFAPWKMELGRRMVLRDQVCADCYYEERSADAVLREDDDTDERQAG